MIASRIIYKLPPEGSETELPKVSTAFYLRDLELIFFIQKIKKQQHEQQPLVEGLIAGAGVKSQSGPHLYDGPLVGREVELRSYGGEFRGLLEFLRTLRTIFVVVP